MRLSVNISIVTVKQNNVNYVKVNVEVQEEGRYIYILGVVWINLDTMAKTFVIEKSFEIKLLWKIRPLKILYRRLKFLPKLIYPEVNLWKTFHRN